MALEYEKQAKPSADRLSTTEQLKPEPPVAVPPEAGAAPGLLQEVLPEITALAQRVGGFRQLAEIAELLDRSAPVKPTLPSK